MEEDVFGAGGVAEDGVDGGDGAAEVAGVECHGDVDQWGVAGEDGDAVRGGGGAARTVSVVGGFGEAEEAVEGGDGGGGGEGADPKGEGREEEAHNEGQNDGV